MGRQAAAGTPRALFAGMLATIASMALSLATRSDDLVAEAWANSPTVTAAEAAVQAADADAEGASVILPNPELDVGAHSDFAFANQGELDLDISLLQPVAWPGSRLAMLDGARKYAHAARIRLAIARLNIAADVEEAVGARAAAVDEARVRKEMARLATSLGDAGKRRLAVGAGSSLESAVAAADAALAQAASETADARVAVATALLCTTVARQSCDLGDDASWPPLAVLPSSGSATAVRADVEATTLEGEAAKNALNAAVLARIPQARIGLGYSFQRSVFDAPSLSAPLRDDNHLLGASLAVTLPVWDWNTREVERARSAVMNTDASRRRATLTAQHGVAAALANLGAAERAETKLAAVDADVDRALRDVEAGYVAGALSLDEALTSRDRLLRARLELIAARNNRVRAHAEALRALSNPSLVGIAEEVEPSP